MLLPPTLTGCSVVSDLSLTIDDLDTTEPFNEDETTAAILAADGLRFAVWVQGCSIRCPGCFNPQLWGTRGGTAWDPAALLERVPDDVEGVTLLGGEPFEQAARLAAFARAVRARGQSVMTITGYTHAELRERTAAVPGTRELLAETDLLVDGPFLIDRLDRDRAWVRSTSQGFHALTPRYANLADGWSAFADRVEVRVLPDATVEVNGWADVDALDQLLQGLSRTRTPFARVHAGR